jgi:proline iminopeptidase
MTTLSIRGVSLFVKVLGQGYPLLLMHGGPGLDHSTLLSFRRLADQFTLVFYDHRCNGRSNGVPVSSMTWENLTADADALREALGFEKWAVLGHSFGGQVALEYALRYPHRLSHLILMDTGGDQWWPRENAPELLARRGFKPETVEIARRWCHGQIEPNQMVPYAQKLAGAYEPHLSLWQAPRELIMALRMKTRAEAFLFGFRELSKDWNVMDRLGEINTPTLVMAGRDDWLFPPEHQVELAAGIRNTRLHLVERAGHNPQSERTAEVMEVVRSFLRTAGAAPNGPEDTNSPYEAIDAYVERERRRLKIPGVSLAIVEGDQIVHQRGFGLARPDGETPTPQTPFFIGSLTKSFTALAVMQLVEAGKVELDAPVQRYLPWFRVADARQSAEITVRQLLHQISGLSRLSGEIQLADSDSGPGATERQARALAALELGRPAGEAFEYSNANYNLLGPVIEAVSGLSYADYVQKQILDPLGMDHTYTSPALAKQNGLAVGHRYWFAHPIAAPNLPVPLGALPGGLLSSTAEDMARYLSAHLNGDRYGDLQILSTAGFEEMHRGVVNFAVSGLGPAQRFIAKYISLGQYGMGWCVDKLGQTRVVWHGGTLPDHGAFMSMLPQQKKGIVLLYNANHHWMLPVFAGFGMGATALLAGEPYKPLPFARAIPWMLRAQLLLPVLQAVGIAGTLLRLRRWRLNPEQQPTGAKAWRRHLVLPLVTNLQVGLALLQPMLGKRRGYLRLYMPDFSLLAAVCGSFTLLWTILRSGLVGRVLRMRPERRVSRSAPDTGNRGYHV